MRGSSKLGRKDLKTIKFLDNTEGFAKKNLRFFRLIALGIILTRAGVELSPKQLMKLKGIVPALAFTPCVVEALTCGGISYVFFNVLESRPQYKMDIAMCFTAGYLT